MRKKISSKKLAVLGVLLAAASIAFMIESLVPPLITLAPYVKIGIANVFVLLVIVFYDFREGLLFVLAKNIISALFSWSVFVFAFNIAGSLAAFFVMYFCYRLFGARISLVSVSIAGAVFSNIARTAVGVLLLDTQSLWVQLPIVCVFSIFAGILIGVLTTLCIKILPDVGLSNI